MDGWTDGQADRRMNGQMDGQMNGWMDGWMDGLMDGWIKTGTDTYAAECMYRYMGSACQNKIAAHILAVGKKHGPLMHSGADC